MMNYFLYSPIAISFVRYLRLLIIRSLCCVLLNIALFGGVGFDDRLQFYRLAKVCLHGLILRNAVSCLGTVGAIVLISKSGLCWNQISLSMATVAVGASELKEWSKSERWKQRNKQNQQQKRTLKKQNGRLVSKLFGVRNALSREKAARVRGDEKAAEVTATNSVLKNSLKELEAQRASSTEALNGLQVEVNEVRQHLESMTDTLEFEVESSKYSRPSKAPYPIQLVICLIRVCIAGKGIRSSIRILEILNSEQMLDYRVPCATSVNNWIYQVGLGMLKSQKKIDEPYILIVDHCKAVGSIKLFVALALRQSTYEQAIKEKRALCLKDLHLVDLLPMKESKGVSMCAVYRGIFSKLGRKPCYVLSDKGPDLALGLKLHNELRGEKVEFIHDYSHMTANLLKANYDNQEWLSNLTTDIHSGSASLRQGKHAHLAAPALGTKARYMNIKKRLEWVDSVYILTQGSGRPVEGSDKDILQKAYPTLRTYQQKVKEMLQVCRTIDEIGGVLKRRGFSNESNAKASAMLSIHSPEHPVVLGIHSWLKSTNMLQLRLTKKGWNAPLPISSDPIESLFSHYKAVLSTMPIPEPTRCILKLVLLCANPTNKEIANAFNSTSMKDLESWVEGNLPDSQIKKRKKLKQDLHRKKSKTGDIPKSKKGSMRAV